MNFHECWRLVQRLFAYGQTHFLSFTHIVAIASVALSSATLIITLAVLGGFQRTFEETVTFFAAHIDARSTSSQGAQAYTQWLQLLQSWCGEQSSIVAYRELEILLIYKGNVEAALLRIDTPSISPTHTLPTRYSNFSTLLHWGIGIGRPLAERLGIALFDTLTIVASKRDNRNVPLDITFFRLPIESIYETGLRQLDEITVFGAPSLFHHRIARNASTHGFRIWLSSSDKSRVIAQRLDSLAGRYFYIRTFDEIYPSMFLWIALQKRPIPIVVSILSIVAAFNILTLLFVVLVERSSSIAILHLIGLRQRDLLTMVTGYGAWIGMTGFFIGSVVAYIFTLAQSHLGLVHLDAEVYFIDRLPVDIQWWHVGTVGLITTALSLAATALPVLAAMRISPLMLLRIKQ